MMCAGLDPRFYEPGLSSGTGNGYLDRHSEELFMMEPLLDHPVSSSSSLRPTMESSQRPPSLHGSPCPETHSTLTS